MAKSLTETGSYPNIMLDKSQLQCTFVKLSKPLWNPLLRFGMSLSGSQNDAEDLLQSTLLKALNHFPRFAENFVQAQVKPSLSSKDFFTHLETSAFAAYLKNWLYRILKNTFLDTVSKQRRLVLVDSFGEGSFPEPTAPDILFSSSLVVSDFESVNSQVESNGNREAQEKEFFREALDDSWQKKFEQLNAKQRSVIFLVAEGYSYKEVAVILSLPIGTVMSTLSRTLAKLKKTDLLNSTSQPSSQAQRSSVEPKGIVAENFVRKMGIK